MVRFAHGERAAIGFHDIPADHDGGLVQTRDQLGTPPSAGCIRQWRPDAVALWRVRPRRHAGRRRARLTRRRSTASPGRALAVGRQPSLRLLLGWLRMLGLCSRRAGAGLGRGGRTGVAVARTSRSRRTSRCAGRAGHADVVVDWPATGAPPVAAAAALRTLLRTYRVRRDRVRAATRRCDLGGACRRTGLPPLSGCDCGSAPGALLAAIASTGASRLVAGVGLAEPTRSRRAGCPGRGTAARSSSRSRPARRTAGRAPC